MNICEKNTAPGEGRGLDFLTGFWKEKYLQEYIPAGGSKLKFVTGRPGSGKTFFLNSICRIARQENYRTVSFSARDIWLHDFKELYAEIFRQCDILPCLEGCSKRVIENMGYRPQDIPDGMSFMDYLSQIGMGDAITKRELRTQLKLLFLDNPVLDNNFALACSMLTGAILGHPVLERQNQELLLSWLSGDRTVKLALLRAFGMSPSRITKYNARHMLRSLAEIVHLGGFSGLFVAVDDLEILLNRSADSELHYTKVKREDTYESIRQMVDDIDNMNHIMFVFAFDRALIDDEKCGVKSYQALWMRIQNEVTGQRFNRFSDIVDLDRLAVQEYGVEELIHLSEQLCRELTAQTPWQPHALTPEQAAAILSQSKTSAVGIPGLVRTTLTGGNSHV
ncbi:MAG: DUF2791 family P-loop domain-containing protein [Eubacteriales bacterium]|nr:DUF2791 family P-loop domain-containing protein [Eubacteriales bacterium]